MARDFTTKCFFRRFFQLDERPAEVLRVQEQHRGPVGAEFRLAVAENSSALPGEGYAARTSGTSSER